MCKYSKLLIVHPFLYAFLSKVAVRVRPLNAAEVDDKNCTEIVHVLDENVSKLLKYLHVDAKLRGLRLQSFKEYFHPGDQMHTDTIATCRQTLSKLRLS